MQLKIFISYAHNDSSAKEALLKECAVFKHENQVLFWSDDNIRAGDLFDEVLKNEIESCDACVIIASNNYWAKDYIRDQELPFIIQNEKDRQMRRPVYRYRRIGTKRHGRCDRRGQNHCGFAGGAGGYRERRSSGFVGQICNARAD